ncbi:MAG: Nascent polypeptide-associated complex protein [Thermoplasmata archaeon]|jgi:nascent polypeptide-associated complex subunit alpha|nr:Nascent polypeptide-associated complex protein [Thermoplasmata archaeon]
MMPGMKMNDRQMKQAMKKMGIKQTAIPDVVEVVIRTKTSETVIKAADVICIEMPGGKSYQVTGPETVRAIGEGESVAETPTFSDEDIELVMSQTGCERDAAVKALSESNGEPAEAIIKLISG